MADQALLSALNFGAGIFLIRHVTKDVYGAYVQLFALGVLACAVIDSLVANAVANLSSRTPEADMPRVLANAHRLARLMGVGLAAVAVLAMQWAQPDAVSGWARWAVSLTFGIYLAALAFRDFKRTLLYLVHRATDVLWLDGLYVALCVVAGAAPYAADRLSISTIFLGMALANAVAVVATRPVVALQATPGWRALDQTLRTCWGIARWALPGIVVGWASTSGYLYVTGSTLGVGATAELNASRLMIMPLILITMAWHQMARADIARLVGQAEWLPIRAFIGKSVLLLYVPAAAYLVVLWGGYPWIKPMVVTAAYQAFDALLFAWLLYFAVYVVKFLGLGLLVGFEAYKPLFKLSVCTLALQMGLLWTLTPHWGMVSAIWVLTLTEVVELLVMWLVLLPRQFKGLSRPGFHPAVPPPQHRP